MNKWNYGDAFKRYPLAENQVAVFSDGSKLKVHNLFNPMPEFMKEADLVFVDPPWNLGNLNTFYTKAGRTDHQGSFVHFYKYLFHQILNIHPKTCYIEIGKEYLGEFLLVMKDIYHQVTFYNSTYYHKKDRLCYVIRGSAKRQKLPLDGLDEEDIIKWICANEEYSCIGDFCIGLGLVGIYAYANQKRFVGTELNHKRLSVLIEKLVAAGITYNLEAYHENNLS